MTRRQVLALAASGLVVLAVALPAGWLRGSVHWVAALVAVALCLPAAFGTLWFAHWMAGRHPLGGVIGMFAGTAARLLVAFGGGLVLFLLVPELRRAGISFWVWLLFAYLSTLVVETALFAKGSLAAAGGVSGGKG